MAFSGIYRGTSQTARVEHSPAVDLTGWEFRFGDLEPAVSDKITEAIEYTFGQHPPEVSLPAMWDDDDGIGGPRPADPLTLYVKLELGREMDDRPAWSISLRDVCLDVADLHRARESGKVEDPEGAATLRQIAAALRRLAVELEAEISTQ